jgi:hypothetical protein
MLASSVVLFDHDCISASYDGKAYTDGVAQFNAILSDWTLHQPADLYPAGHALCQVGISIACASCFPAHQAFRHVQAIPVWVELVLGACSIHPQQVARLTQPTHCYLQSTSTIS